MLSHAEKLGITLPFSETIDLLKQPLDIGGQVIPNRIAVQPMEGCDGTADGKPDELTSRRYNRLARGGYGLIWFEATAVVHEGRANPRQLLMSERNLDDFRKLLKDTLEISSNTYGEDLKPYTVLQLTHSGRYSRPESGPQPIVAAKNPHLDNKVAEDTIRIISDDELGTLEERYADAAVLASEAGFDAVDIKSCHGYLSSELLSARTRDGIYGGSFENRTRFLLNIIDRIQRRTDGKLAIAIRLNAYDGVPYPYGWGVDPDDAGKYDLTEPLRLVKILSERGVKLINISAGIPYHNPHIGRPFDKGAYVPAEHPLNGVVRMLNIGRNIQKEIPETAVVASGFSWLREFGAHVAAGGIRDGWFSLAGFGRQVFAYPGFPVDIYESGGMDRKKCCVACSKCSEIMRYDGRTGCVVHDSPVYLPMYREAKKRQKDAT